MKRLTASLVGSVKPPKQGQIELYDHDLPGFALRVAECRVDHGVRPAQRHPARVFLSRQTSAAFIMMLYNPVVRLLASVFSARCRIRRNLRLVHRRLRHRRLERRQGAARRTERLGKSVRCGLISCGSAKDLESGSLLFLQNTLNRIQILSRQPCRTPGRI